MEKIRGFEVVRDEFRVHPNATIKMPKRKTFESAGYDFAVVKGAIIPPHEVVHFMTDVKVYMQPDEVLLINVRSSIGFKKKLRLVNTQGWIDSDFYNNPDNDGNIGIGLYNPFDFDVVIEDGERVAQGMFVKYLTKDNDEQDDKSARIGGTGSTGEQ